MEEAKFSFNVRFNLKGFDCQYTVRSDENGIAILRAATTVIEQLEGIGATGERRWEATRNGSKEISAPPQPKSDEPAAGAAHGPVASARVIAEARESHTTGVIAMDDSAACPLCGVVGRLELIGFVRGKSYRQAWKCQACEQWLPNQR